MDDTIEQDEHPVFVAARALYEPWRAHFPKDAVEAHAWKPAIFRKALASRVLYVARTRIEGAWNAYCDAVPGHNHDHETGPVLEHGAKLDEGIARAIFPYFDGVPYAR